jgi:hypothetical protein
VFDSSNPKNELPVPGVDKSVRSPLKPGINPTFRGIVVQVRIFGLKRAKMPFSAEIFPWNAIYAIIHFKSTFS